jgi:hypothetical protein
MKYLVLLAGLISCQALSADYIEITVNAGQTRVVDESFPRQLNLLILADNARLELAEDQPELKLTVSELVIGKSVVISTQGRNGADGNHLTGRENRREHGVGPGTHGQDAINGSDGAAGKDILISAETLKFLSFSLVTTGGNGGNGGNAKGGGKGSNASCPEQTGGNGGNGGTGGAGGRGGAAGKALITFTEVVILPDADQQLLQDPYHWIADGGTGGHAGSGGAGGKGGNSSDCGPTDVAGGVWGNPGEDGAKGAGGASKDPAAIPWLKYH